ncbi:MAG: ATP-binding protein [Snowella sp.]|nr:ATP-binding protein [Snowella sp.]
MEKSTTSTSSRIIYQQIASLLLYQSVFENEIGTAFTNFLQTLFHSHQDQSITSIDCLKAYSYWFKLLTEKQQSWQDFLVEQILLSNNAFSHQVQLNPLEELPASLLKAVEHDLQILQNIYDCPLTQIIQWVEIACQKTMTIIPWEIANQQTFFSSQSVPWSNYLPELGKYYRQKGAGIFALYHAFQWQDNQLLGVTHPDPISLSELVGYETAKSTLIQNTQFLLRGYPALHVLLYGSRGSGKSSLIKAILNEYASQGLRLIEVSKSELQALPKIVEKLRLLPQKFILFVDDLSFEEDDDSFKSLKVVLEGGVTAKARNVVVYATSNRRHLIREFFSDRPRPLDADEVQAWDTVQEKLSFSDRFGLTLTFEPANQDTYLGIVRHLAQKAGIGLNPEELEFRAKQWATQHNGRSGRTARQFIDFLQGELALTSSLG